MRFKPDRSERLEIEHDCAGANERRENSRRVGRAGGRGNNEPGDPNVLFRWLGRS